MPVLAWTFNEKSRRSLIDPMAPPTSTARQTDAPRVPDLLERVDEQLTQLLRGQGLARHRGIISVTLPLTGLGLGPLPAPYPGTVYWVSPGRRRHRFAMGNVYALEAEGEDRFRRLDAGYTSLRRKWQCLDPAASGLVPQAFLGFDFEAGETGGCATARLQIPELLLERAGSGWSLTFSGRVRPDRNWSHLRARWLERAGVLLGRLREQPVPPIPGSITRVETAPSEGEWLDRVQRALEAIRKGRFRKVVLTRRTRVEAEGCLHAGHVLRWLEEQYPDCAQFAYADADFTLVGASPERLVRRVGSRVLSDAVASTAVRDLNAQVDRALGDALLGCTKARHEHRLVVDAIVDALQPLCKALDVPSAPRLMKLLTIQHLWTPVMGELKPGVSILQLIERLHPTPAVGGVPRDEALRWMDRNGEQRGWYTGALGWLAPDGSGDVSVVLRCALLGDRFADLYAGAGIVADSDPASELAETEWKFQTMLDALAMGSGKERCSAAGDPSSLS